MASPWVTGPVHVYLARGAGTLAGSAVASAALYLGTTEGGPEYDHTPSYEPVMNDLSGSKIPFDLLLMGQEAHVFGTFTRINFAVLHAIEAIISGRTRGLLSGSDLGTLMLAEGQTFHLFLKYAGAARAAMIDIGLPLGIHYPAAIMETNKAPLGNRAGKISLGWHCIQAYSLSTAFGLLGGMLLYDDSGLNALPAIN